MNPFLQSTVATPQPCTSWHRPSRRSRRGAAARNGVAASSPDSVARRPAVAERPATRPRSRSRGGLLRIGRVLRAVTLAGSLLLPGMAAAIDINTATPEQLQEVKGIGPKMARVIIDERERGGRFESITDVAERVKGIGPKKAASLQDAGLTVGSAAAVAASGAGAGGARRNR